MMTETRGTSINLSFASLSRLCELNAWLNMSFLTQTLDEFRTNIRYVNVMYGNRCCFVVVLNLLCENLCVQSHFVSKNASLRCNDVKTTPGDPKVTIS